MIQEFAQNTRYSAPRRAVLVLLALFLNVALVPCTMALEVVENDHDCCPPELNLESPECCGLDDVGVDTRNGLLEDEGGLDTGAVSAPSWVDPTQRRAALFRTTVDPPDRPGPPSDLNALFCVYLK